MTEYVLGTKEDKAEIIDFINYVFSQNEEPHDFKRLQPKCYADHVEGLGADHYLVKEDGRIKALIALRTIYTDAVGQTLKIGEIGNVSVHPYSRKKGYMKALMKRILEDAQKQGIDCIILGGQRQRYEYFGFQHAGYLFSFYVSHTNLRHRLSDLDDSGITFTELDRNSVESLDFIQNVYEKRPLHVLRDRTELPDILHNNYGTCYLIRDGETLIGYTMSGLSECVLTDESYFPKVLKAAFRVLGFRQITLRCAAFETERIAFLTDICEDYSLAHVEMFNVLNWEHILNALLSLKAATCTLEDGTATFGIDDSAYRITIKDNQVSVQTLETLPDGAPCYTKREAELRFLQLGAFTQSQKEYHNWFPLPFCVTSGDTF